MEAVADEEVGLGVQVETYSLVTAPTAEPLSERNLIGHLRADWSTEGPYLTSLITSARRWLERRTNQLLITQTWDMFLPAFPSANAAIKIRRRPVQSVTSVKYTDSDGNTSTVDSGDYNVDTASLIPRIVLKATKQWPSVVLDTVNAVVVRFVGGYGDSGNDVPEELIQAMRRVIAHHYENREATIPTVMAGPDPYGIESLVADYDARIPV